MGLLPIRAVLAKGPSLTFANSVRAHEATATSYIYKSLPQASLGINLVGNSQFL